MVLLQLLMKGTTSLTTRAGHHHKIIGAPAIENKGFPLFGVLEASAVMDRTRALVNVCTTIKVAPIGSDMV